MASNGKIIAIVGGMIALAWMFGDHADQQLQTRHIAKDSPTAKLENNQTGTIVYKIAPKSQIQPPVNAPKKLIDTTKAESFPETHVYVRANRLNIREAPSTSAPLVARVSRDGRLIVTGKLGKWLRVDLNGLQAWVHGDYVASVKTAHAVAKQPLQGQRGQRNRLSDDEIVRKIIAQSLARYSGRCPCPYNVMRNGRRCGGRSAYSRPGGANPLCYPGDVSRAMVADFRSRSY